MPETPASPRQRALFSALARCGELILSCGPEGIRANIVGEFRLVRHGGEDRLDAGDGTQHVHIDWQRVRHAVVGQLDGEGVIDFQDGEETLFRLYRPAGPYGPEVAPLAGDLLPA